ncbi:MAG: hypothetical protein H0X66_20715 [Verrucomicrobia bacterium]|nr:hypothetical protein [Verrucomicrobiota bacterium]
MTIIVKIVVALGLLALFAVILIKVFPFILLLLAAVGLWKLYQAMSRPDRPPRNPIDWNQ